MPAVSGVSFIIKVNTGTEQTPVWTAVGGQRDATLKMTSEEIDVTSKDSSGWHEALPGIRTWSIEFESLLIEGDAGLIELENAFLSKEQVMVQVATPAGNKYEGKATLSEFSYKMPYKGEATASGKVTGTGALMKTVA
jgi:TP901-1 family phage major tail protein